MKHVALAAFAAASVIATTAAAETSQANGLEVRFCPGGAVHAYSMNDQRGVQSLVLQDVAVVNHSAAPVEVTSAEIELIRAGQVIDQRRLTIDDIRRAGAAQGGLGQFVQVAAFQFCGDRFVTRGLTLAGPTVGPNQAMLVLQNVFSYRGLRDQVRVRFHGAAAGQDVAVEGTIPIAGSSRKPYRFPLKGTWYVANGPSFNTQHRWALPEEFGFDIVKLGPSGVTHGGAGTAFSDYYAYGADVMAMAPGTVAAVHDGEAEDPHAMQQPGETTDAFYTRLLQDQGARLMRGEGGVAGNFVVIDYGDGEYGMFAHLQPGSLKVKVGDKVVADQVVGKLGSSGNSTEPHLHFQLCDAPKALDCAGIPMQFSNVTPALGDPPQTLQSGDIIIVK